MILVDSSVWITHLRSGVAGLAAALEEDLVVSHPFVVGEIACGNIGNRPQVLSLLRRLPSVPVASHAETLAFVEARALMGRGVGYVDAHLLASLALSDGIRLWTRDRRLALAAEEMGFV